MSTRALIRSAVHHRSLLRVDRGIDSQEQLAGTIRVPVSRAGHRHGRPRRPGEVLIRKFKTIIPPCGGTGAAGLKGRCSGLPVDPASGRSATARAKRALGSADSTPDQLTSLWKRPPPDSSFAARARSHPRASFARLDPTIRCARGRREMEKAERAGVEGVAADTNSVVFAFV
jgi:hypothetical protein